MPRNITKLQDIVDWRMCVGCGACAYICPEQKVRLADFVNEGIRPVGPEASCGGCVQCLQVCPALESDFRPSDPAIPVDGFWRQWGTVLEIWEGHATDPEIRFQGSSGGALSAIAAYCIEKRGMHGVLHIGQDPTDPLRNTTRLSRTREEIVSASGSRYSPASVCNGLSLVESAPAPCVVIGKPSEASAVRNAGRMRETLRNKVGVLLSFFCAETPATAGPIALLRKHGADPSQVAELRYRGRGWPGNFKATGPGGAPNLAETTYRESWGFMQAFRPWSVQFWPDGTGELADITCGDPWYEKPDGRNPGFSIIVVRTPRGREILAGAIREGYLTLTPAERWKLEKSQAGLIKKKGAVWGRQLVAKLLGLPVARYLGLDLFFCWRKLPPVDKVKSTIGTFRRIFSRRIYRPLRLNLAKEGKLQDPIRASDGAEPSAPAPDAARRDAYLPVP